MLPVPGGLEHEVFRELTQPAQVLGADGRCHRRRFAHADAVQQVLVWIEGKPIVRPAFFLLPNFLCILSPGIGCIGWGIVFRIQTAVFLAPIIQIVTDRLCPGADLRHTGILNPVDAPGRFPMPRPRGNRQGGSPRPGQLRIGAGVEQGLHYLRVAPGGGFHERRPEAVFRAGVGFGAAAEQQSGDFPVRGVTGCP